MNWPHFFLDLALRGLFISGVSALAVWKLRGLQRNIAAAFGLCALLLLPAAQMLPRWGVTLPNAADAISAVSIAATSWQMPLTIWGAGCLIVIARLLPGWMRLRQWRLESVRASNIRILAETRDAAMDLGLRSVPEVRITAFRTMPVVCGFWRGVVYLPEDALKWTTERLRIVLLHELAHLRRRDPGMQTLAWLACALHWFNPLAWVLHRAWLRGRELATDALVLSTGVTPKGYAMHLVEIAEKFRVRVPQMLPAAPMAGPALEQRVRHILSWVPRPSSGRRGLAIAILLSAAGLVAAAATFLPHPAAPLPGTPEEAEADLRLSANPFPDEPAGD
jgi:beta-lactamase regulating signal transducer with metallopeptidase domain